MAVRKVAAMGHPVLRMVAEPVDPNEIGKPWFKQLIIDMVDTMAEYDGRGLAAPQIHESRQIVLMLWDFDANKEAHLLILVNPKLKNLTTETSGYWEGCLSLPGLRGFVSRPNRVHVQAVNEKGEPLDFIAEGFAATVVQHECDHLLGKLYIDRMADLTQLAFTREFQRYHASADDQPDEGDAE